MSCQTYERSSRALQRVTRSLPDADWSVRRPRRAGRLLLLQY